MPPFNPCSPEPASSARHPSLAFSRSSPVSLRSYCPSVSCSPDPLSQALYCIVRSLIPSLGQRDSLEGFLLLVVRHVLPARQVLQWCREALHSRHGPCRGMQARLRAWCSTLVMPVIELHVVIARLRGIISRVNDLLEQANLVRLRSKDEVFHLLDAVQLRDDLERVPLSISETSPQARWQD